MNIFALSGLLNLITNSAMALLIFWKGKRPLHYLWGVFCVSVIVWGIGGYRIAVTPDPVKAVFWWKVTYVGVIFIPVLFTHFVHKFLNIKRHLLILVIYILGGFFLILNLFTDLFIDQVRWVFDQFYYISPPAPFYTPFVALFVGLVIYSHVLLWKAYRTAQGIQKTQIKYLFIATFVSFGGGTFSYLPVYKIDLYPFLNLTVFLLSPIVAYAIFKYRLMDLRIVVRKAFIYLGVAAFTYGMFYFIAWIYTEMFGGVFTRSGYLLGLIIAPIFVAIFYWLSKALQKFAHKYLFTSLTSYQEAITGLSQKLNYYIQLNRVIDLIVSTIQDTMKLQRAGVLLIEHRDDTIRYKIAKVIGFKKENGISLVQDSFLTHYLQRTRKPLVKDEIDFLVRDSTSPSDQQSFARLKAHMSKIEAAICLPLIRQNKLRGIIVLGPKLSGDAYSQEDLELLNTLSNQASVAIENARLYREVHEFSKTLEQKVAEQTQEIRKQNIYLKDLIKMKGEFLNIASHQLKTPISITRGYLSMLLDGTLKGPKKRLDSLQKAMAGIDRLNETVKDFLDASDLEGKDIELELEKTDLFKLIKSIVDGKELLAKKKGLKLIFNQPPKKLSLMKLDPSRLYEAIANLVDNAVFYTEKGEVTVTLSQAEKKKEAIIKVADTGIGISPEEQKKLFTKFTRGKKAILTKPDGSGLGLYISKRIIDLHKGSIKLKSEAGKGTTFIISLPTTL